MRKPIVAISLAVVFSTALIGRDVARSAVDGAASPSRASKPDDQQIFALLRKKVKYVFVLYQENRSFDSYFGTFPGADGLFSHPADETPGFYQPLIGTDGARGTVHPFRIGPKEYAADTDDIDHSHRLTVEKMDVRNGAPRMDRFALTEERKYSPTDAPSLMSKQFGELAMAYEDCDTIPLLWRYADRFVLFDHVFEEMAGPSTPGNLSIIAAQSGVTQWALHPGERWSGDANRSAGEPVLNDRDPLFGSPRDESMHKLPVNPADFKGLHPYGIQRNQTYAALPLTMAGKSIAKTVKKDADPAADLHDVSRDVQAIARRDQTPVAWRWYQEGFDREPTDPKAPDDSPLDANGVHASYITHHNGPQYFGYIANNPKMAEHLRGLKDFFDDVEQGRLPSAGGLFYVKGGYKNIMGLKPSDPDATVQKKFLGDDDHPAYSDAQISEAMVASAVNVIAASKYWPQSAVIITWDDSEGDYDHVPPPLLRRGPDGSFVSDGPRVPLILVSPYARAHYVAHAQGSQASVVKFVDRLFDLPPLATLPDELEGRKEGRHRFHERNLGPDDALTKDVNDLSQGFDLDRLRGDKAPLTAAYALIPQNLVSRLPEQSHYNCKALGIRPVDRQKHIRNAIPADFNPRPRTTPAEPRAPRPR